MAEDLFSTRKSLDQICTVPDKIISVYSLEQHVWADSGSEEAKALREPELQTLEEFQIEPVRPFLNDVLRNMAAPYNPDRRDNPTGQGYWIQAEFGSGKSHLLCFLSALALGNAKAWEVIKQKEEKAGRGKRDSIYRFWEESIQAKSEGSKGVFVVVKTLVGSGGGAVGIDDRGKRLVDYILDAVKEQLRIETGENPSLYPAELLAERFLSRDLDRYRGDLRKFLRDPRFFSEDEYEDVGDFLRDMQENRSPQYRLSCGRKLWRFYEEYLEVRPQIDADVEQILAHMVRTILDLGYAGVLLVLDEVSLFMKNRNEDQRTDDESTLVVLANRLTRTHNLPIWTVCSAQQAIESRLGVRNIIAEDRLKLVELLKNEADYYQIVLSRVREIVDPGAVGPYYLYYKRGFSWPNAIGEKEFAAFFPFHKPALEVLRAVSFKLTTTRSAISVMHQVLKHQIRNQGRELIRLWELFDETVRYEEDPSGTYASLSAIRTQFETDYRAYETAKRQIDGVPRGPLKIYRDRAVRSVQTLFLYHVGQLLLQGLTPEQIANSVLIERNADATVAENLEHYESIAENLRRELAQIASSTDEDGHPRYRFNPIATDVRDPRKEFERARAEAETSEVMRREAWEQLLALDEWVVRTRQMALDLSSGVKSIFREVARPSTPGQSPPFSQPQEKELDLVWKGRQVTGLVAMRNLPRVDSDRLPLPAIDSDQTDRDFALLVSSYPTTPEQIARILGRKNDPRVLLWSPDDLRLEERDRLLDFAAYRKMVSAWQGKETEEAVAIIHWVANALQTEMGRIYKIVPDSYGRGRIDALNNTEMPFSAAGELSTILVPLVDRVLTAAYESRDIAFDPPFVFKKEEAVKVINGIVKTGEIPRGRSNQNTSAAQNFGLGLKIIQRGDERKLDVSGNPYVQAIWEFLDRHLGDDGASLSMESLYKNFMGIGPSRAYGLTRRMVQLYLLCLVREGRVRVELGPRSGVAYTFVDYSNVADVEFSANVLAAMTRVQKVARPENWEVLRPYAEKLLNEKIAESLDEAQITEYRGKLLALFGSDREASRRLQSRLEELFAVLRAANPYQAEIGKVVALFDRELSVGDDIDVILYGLKETLGYQAYDSGRADPREVDDLALLLATYRDLGRFAGFDRELRLARAQCDQPLPESPALDPLRAAQTEVGRKLSDLRPYIDSEVKLRTELIGSSPAQLHEKGTIGALAREYTSAYCVMHERVQDEADGASEAISDLLTGDLFTAFRKLEGITVLQPPAAAVLESQIRAIASGIPVCPSPSRASVEKELRTSPMHQCGLTFMNAADAMRQARRAESSARDLLDETVSRKLEIFLAPAIIARLEQGKGEPVIDGLLACRSVQEVRDALVPAVLPDEGVVETINRHLKRIVVKAVKLSDFTPTVGAVEKGQIGNVVEEFRRFLEGQMAEIEAGDDVLPVLQIS